MIMVVILIVIEKKRGEREKRPRAPIRNEELGIRNEELGEIDHGFHGWARIGKLATKSTKNTEEPRSRTSIEHPETSIQHPASNIEHPEIDSRKDREATQRGKSAQGRELGIRTGDEPSVWEGIEGIPQRSALA